MGSWATATSAWMGSPFAGVGSPIAASSLVTGVTSAWGSWAADAAVASVDDVAAAGFPAGGGEERMIG